MSTSPVSLPRTQINALLDIHRKFGGYASYPTATVKALVTKGLVRYAHNEFIFGFAAGSSNSGYVLTETGLATLEHYRPATDAEIMSALEAIPNPTPEQRSALRRLRRWGKTGQTTRGYSVTAVKLAA